ncbi:MAG: hypothetical protein ACK5LJ_15720 [Paracoccus sp. (in: a-proteobacteria)]
MTSKERRFWRFDNPIVWGIYASLVVAIFGAWLASLKDCKDSICVDKFSQFLTLPPNAIGDSLAGFAGALAFVWLIATVWLQGQELAEQRKELSRMADAQADQVRVLRLQGEIYEEEQDQRRREQADQLLTTLVDSLIELVGRAETWEWTRDADGHTPNIRVLGPFLPDEFGPRERFLRVLVNIRTFRSRYHAALSVGSFPTDSPEVGASRQALGILKQMKKLRPKLSLAAQTFQPYQELKEAIFELELILCEDDYWSGRVVAA